MTDRSTTAGGGTGDAVSGAAVELLGLLRNAADPHEMPLSVSEPPDEKGVRVEFPNPHPSAVDRLVVEMNREGDVDVEVHVPDRRGSPFTQHFPRCPDPAFVPEVAAFVGDFLAERLVLACRRGWFRGGREFVEPGRARGEGAERYAWVASWKDSYRGRIEGNRGRVRADDRALARVRDIAGTDDVERLDLLPATAVYDDRTLHPESVIRVGSRLFAEMREHPGEWWMGELDGDGVLRVWGSYGSLEEAVRHH